MTWFIVLIFRRLHAELKGSETRLKAPERQAQIGCPGTRDSLDARALQALVNSELPPQPSKALPCLTS